MLETLDEVVAEYLFRRTWVADVERDSTEQLGVGPGHTG